MLRILVVEDDRECSDRLVLQLRGQGFNVVCAIDGEEALLAARGGGFDLILADRNLPKRDGLWFIKELRKGGDTTPAIFISALGEVDNRIEGLKAGGDDYLIKPFNFHELLARMQALARRAYPVETQTRLKVGGLELDLLSRKVFRDGQEITLQPREFRLLEFLMKHADQVVTRTMLLEHVWEYHFDPQTNVIDVHVSRLRAKIDRAFGPQMLHTVRGFGYSIRTPH